MDITFSMPGTALLTLGWDAGVEHLKDEEPEIVKAIKNAKEVKRGKGYSLIVTCPAEVAVYSVLERLEFYEDGSGKEVTPHEIQVARKVCNDIRVKVGRRLVNF